MFCTHLQIGGLRRFEGYLPLDCLVSDLLGPVKLIEMFESFKTFEGEHQLCTKIMMFTLFVGDKYRLGRKIGSGYVI